MWDLPDLATSGGGAQEGRRLHRQRLAAVGGLHRQLRQPLRPRLQLPEQRGEREPDRLARLRRPHRLHRRSGFRLLGRPVRAVQLAAVTAPTYGSVGLESGRNLLIGCPTTSSTSPWRATSAWAAAASSSSGWTCSTRSTRSSTTGATRRSTGRRRLGAEPAVPFRTARSTRRACCRNAGFGAANGAPTMRNFQAMIRFQF